ncbi:3'-5' exonuclease [Hugenholtzia roseola]|uniref:3'-5' exonuclease n=1 Tax=Hugenholtzia roseola TaxID=1002 RepID=UPI0003F7A252|nr:3'-5' exonuclease [Hugenholtzia roseola]
MKNAYFSQLASLLVLDIETVPAYPTFEELPDRFKSLWEKKAQYFLKEGQNLSQVYQERAGIFAEFGKIIVIGVGHFVEEEGEIFFRVKALAADDEKKLLLQFKKIIEKFKNVRLLGHNGKEFDFPYIARRMLVQGIDLPDALNVADKKPWEVSHLDTMQLWRFGDYKHFTSLELLAAIFDLPTSKDDIDGSQVQKVYYQEQDLGRIAHYCAKDVVLTAQVYLRLQNLPLIAQENIVWV